MLICLLLAALDSTVTTFLNLMFLLSEIRRASNNKPINEFPRYTLRGLSLCCTEVTIYVR